jgi:HNH endonuclease
MASRGDGQLDIDDINDIRNGLLLSKVLHTVFGLGQVAFLKVAIMIIE